MKSCFLLLLLWSESCCGGLVQERTSADQEDLSENSSTAHAHGSNVRSGHTFNKRRSQQSSRKIGMDLVINNDALMLTKWVVPAAMKYFEFHKCTATNIGSEDECFKLGQVKKEQVAIYLGTSGSYTNRFENGSTKASSSGGVFAILPDSNSPKSGGAHDAVLVLDPYPTSPFGHLVAMFYLDWVGVGLEGVTRCRDQFQTLTSDGTCITVGRKHRCPNLLERFTSSGLHNLEPKRCHVDFLPTVYSAERLSLPPVALLQGKVDLSSRYPDLLHCIALPGWASCPKLRPVEDTSTLICDSALVNSKRCDTTHATVGSSCKLFQSCDRAVLIGGGWNPTHSSVSTLNNVRIMSDSLQESGFSPDNIKTFYANGRLTSPTSSRVTSASNTRPPRNNGDYFASAMKTALRGHIRSTCDNRHCADTFFIYLNNPTTFEGDFLLWDMDGNGMADELEVYTVKEFLSDLAGCEAKRVVVLVEQANSDILMASLKSGWGSDHGNVILLSAGLPNEVLVGGEFTQSWVNSSSKNPTACLKHVYQIAAAGMTGSNPVFYDPSHGLSSKLSLVGAPCDLSPPVSQKELKTMYQGCQNVPTSIWFSFEFSELGEEFGVEMESGGNSKEDLDEDGVSSSNGDQDGPFSSDHESPTKREKVRRRHHAGTKRRRRARSKLPTRGRPVLGDS